MCGFSIDPQAFFSGIENRNLPLIDKKTQRNSSFSPLCRGFSCSFNLINKKIYNDLINTPESVF